MKKFFVIFIILGTIVLTQSFAQTQKFSIGGGPFFINYVDGGGFADIAFLLFNKKSLDIRNHFIFRGAGLAESSGLFSLSEKLSIGGLLENKFRSYGYIEGGIGLWGNEDKNFFEMPLAYTFGGGGGTDIFLLEHLSICFEAGALIYVLDNDWKYGGTFQISWKGWF
jgi:hypothetical protein